MALLTLRNLHNNLDFSAGTQIKISRNAVARTILFTRIFGKSNTALRWLFSTTARGLPLTPLANGMERTVGARTHVAQKRSIPHIAEATWFEPADVHEAQHR
jgi:farnesyl-diphosphate farnesyltransferase